jgi:hypothetical protein
VEESAGFVSGNYALLLIVDYERSQELLSLAQQFLVMQNTVLAFQVCAMSCLEKLFGVLRALVKLTSQPFNL